jgi:beta-galactosidase
VKKLKENGLSIMFGTPTATFPAWLAKKHPDILSKDEFGRIRVFGGRRQYCFKSTTYRLYAANITKQLVNNPMTKVMGL